MHTSTHLSPAAQALPAAPARSPRAQPAGGSTAGPVRCITSAQILDGETVVEIEHDGMRYRLRQTSLGKLILTK
ncbi:hemin uptake protein HemP [Rhizobacter sp. P5_C2]